MRKYFIFAAAGAGILFTGCDSINGDHRAQTIPVENIPYYEEPAPKNISRTEVQPRRSNVQPIAPAPRQNTPPTRTYQPLRDVRPSGGVSSLDNSGNQSAGDSGSTGFHIVKSGDNPGTIARKYRVRLFDLMKANNLNAESAKKLRVGQKLIIPAKKINKIQEDKVADGKYRVQSGDNPARIAKKLNVKVKDLMEANNLTAESAKKLRVGQLLNIPGKTVATNVKKDTTISDNKNIQVKSQKYNIDDYPQDIFIATEETTFAALAQKYGITEDELRYINGGISSDRIKKGKPIVVPVK